MCESVDRITKFLSPEQLLEYSKSKKGITNVNDTFNYKETLKEESNISVKL